MEDDVDVWHYAILELHARNDDDNVNTEWSNFGLRFFMPSKPRHQHIELVCWCGVVVMRWTRSALLLYIGPDG